VAERSNARRGCSFGLQDALRTPGARAATPSDSFVSCRPWRHTELAALLVAGRGGTEIELRESGRKVQAAPFASAAPSEAARRARFRPPPQRRHRERAILEELSALASQDSLTGTFNRRRFDELGGRISSCRGAPAGAVGVLMIDLDLFKRVTTSTGTRSGRTAQDHCVVVKEPCAPPTSSPAMAGKNSPSCSRQHEKDCVFVAERLRARIAGISLPGEGGSVSRDGEPRRLFGRARRRARTLALFLGAPTEALYWSKAMGRDG